MNYFSDDELRCNHCSLLYLQNGFRDDLNALREQVGHAMQINSGVRCPEHNRKIGGARFSKHLPPCCAVDVDTSNWNASKRWRFVQAALNAGWSVGIAKTFIHIDRRDKQGNAPVLYTY